MNKIIDARGLNCPQPVVLTKKEFDNGAIEVTTLVDNEAARENLKRLGENLGCEVNITAEEGYFGVLLSRDSCQQVVVRTELLPQNKDVILIASEFFGRGEPELGTILIKSFLYTINEAPGSVSSIILMNSGIKLSCEGSPVLELLKSINAQGVNIYACGTCLDFHRLQEKLLVGEITNMYSAWEMMQQAGKVITV